MTDLSQIFWDGCFNSGSWPMAEDFIKKVAERINEEHPEGVSAEVVGGAHGYYIRLKKGDDPRRIKVLRCDGDKAFFYYVYKEKELFLPELRDFLVFKVLGAYEPYRHHARKILESQEYIKNLIEGI